MLSVVIPVLNAAETLPATLASLGRDDGLVSEVVVVDGGSSDDSADVARRGGATVLPASRGRGSQLAAGAAVASNEWLLFLHADTVIRDWDEVRAFVADPDNVRRAAVFTLALDHGGAAARRLERIVAWRTRLLALPYGDQGLLIHRALYGRIGGFRPIPLMEDVDIVRRIGRTRLHVLTAMAVTSAVRYRRGGFVRRPLRNLGCLGLYFLGVPPRALAWLYR